MKHLLILPAVVAFSLAALAFSSSPLSGKLFNVEGGHTMVFAGDSLDVAAMTFIVDGDTVSRAELLATPLSNIFSLTVIKLPANCMEIVTRSSMEMPLDSSRMPGDVVYMIDDQTVNSEDFASFPADSISSLTITKGPAPSIRIVTKVADNS